MFRAVAGGWHRITRRGAGGALPLVVLALLGLGPIADAGAAFPGQNGMLTYVNARGGFDKLFTLSRINADGSGLDELVAPLPNVTINVHPTWSPDGNSVIYQRMREWGGAIYRAKADGSGEVLLTPPGVASGYPAWSPDGSRIDYRRYSTANAADAELWGMNADGSGQQRLIQNSVGPGMCSAWLADMAWGTNGRLAFVAVCNEGNWGLWTAKGDGTEITPVTSVPFELAYNATGLDWSPDASRIVFSSWDTQYPAYTVGECGGAVLANDLFVANVGLNTYAKLTTTSWAGPHQTDPSWSPDGSRIAFAGTSNSCQGTNIVNEPRRIYTMPASGGSAQVVSDPQASTGSGLYGEYTLNTDDSNPDWQPCIAGVTSRCTTVGRPRNTALPTITGAARVGSKLTCVPGTWSGEDALSFRWLRAGVAIAGASAPAYAPTQDDLRSELTCEVSARGAGGSATAASASVTILDADSAPAGSPGSQSKPAVPRASSVIALPSSRRCVSRRAFSIRLRRPAGELLRKLTVRVGARRPITVTRKLSAPIVLRGLPAGRWTVRISVQTSQRSYTLSRRYTTCAAKRRR